MLVPDQLLYQQDCLPALSPIERADVDTGDHTVGLSLKVLDNEDLAISLFKVQTLNNVSVVSRVLNLLALASTRWLYSSRGVCGITMRHLVLRLCVDGTLASTHAGLRSLEVLLPTRTLTVGAAVLTTSRTLFRWLLTSLRGLLVLLCTLILLIPSIAGVPRLRIFRSLIVILIGLPLILLLGRRLLIVLRLPVVPFIVLCLCRRLSTLILLMVRMLGSLLLVLTVLLLFDRGGSLRGSRGCWLACRHRDEGGSVHLQGERDKGTS